MSELFDAGFRAILARVLARARRLRVAGESTELARLRRRGIGGTFAGHRAYTPGEDLRLLDWNAFARSRELHVKVLEAEHRRALTLLLDASPSMAAGVPPRFDGARRLAALIGGVALARLDALTLVVGEERANFAGAASLESMLTWLAARRPAPGAADTPLRAWLTPQRARSRAQSDALRHAGRAVWISDFAETEELRRGLALLAPLRRRVLGLVAAGSDERGLGLEGYVEIVDAERDDRERLRVDPALQLAYAEELRAHGRRVAAAFLAAGVARLRQDVDGEGPRGVAEWTDGGWLDWLL